MWHLYTLSAVWHSETWGCAALLPSNLCVHNQKTRALQVSCHIPVFPQALMENGRMEWEEIYGTNLSWVLKTLASYAATSLSFSLIALLTFSPSICCPTKTQRRGRQASQSATSPKAERHFTFTPKCSAAANCQRQWEHGHHWHLVAVCSWLVSFKGQLVPNPEVESRHVQSNFCDFYHPKYK